MLRYGAMCGFDPKWAEPTLLYASKFGNLLALIPFTSDFDINHRIGGNDTTLMIAAANGQFDAVKTLIDNGADTSIRNSEGRTARQIADNAGHRAVASLLESHATRDWELIKSTESMIEELRWNSNSSDLVVYESLLRKSKFRSLGDSRMDCSLHGNELIWFHATDRCSIGLDDSGAVIWMLDNVRAIHGW